MFDNAGITFLAHSHATILHWINILLRHYAAMLNQHLCAPCKNRLFLRRFVFCMAEASAKRVTGDEPQGAMGRVQTPGEATSRPLSPSRLPLRARFKERRLGTRQMQQCWSNMLAEHDATILRWTNMLVQHYATMSDTLGQHGGSVILRIFFGNFSNDQHNNWTYILLFIALVVSNLNLTWVHVFDLSFALTE